MIYGKKMNKEGIEEGYIKLSPDEIKDFEAGKSLFKIASSVLGDFKITLKCEAKNLLDINKEEVYIGDTIVMPEPTQVDDHWKHGNFEATVFSFKNNQLVTVEDADGDGWDIEANRVEFILELISSKSYVGRCEKAISDIEKIITFKLQKNSSMWVCFMLIEAVVFLILMSI